MPARGCSDHAVRRPLASVLGAVLALLAAARADGLDPGAVRKAAAYSAECRGLSMLVEQHGRVIFEEYPNGHSAGEAHKIYSGTKAFWNLAALAAVQDGILDLDERVAATLPEWRGDARKSRVTLRMLLDFSCGLEPGVFLHRENFANRAHAALELPLVAEPGRVFLYGPSGLQIFHEVLKRKLATRRETPTGFLEHRVLRPLGLGPQRYLKDDAGSPLLASGWMLTAREWARMGRVALADGAPVLSRGSMAMYFRGSAANRAFGFGWWNNRAGSRGREFDLEDMLERDWRRQDWRGATICRDAPADLVACVGSGYQRLFVIPSLDLVIVRQGAGGKFSDGRFLRLMLGK